MTGEKKDKCADLCKKTTQRWIVGQTEKFACTKELFTSKIPILKCHVSFLQWMQQPHESVDHAELTLSWPMALTSSSLACRGTTHWGDAAASTPTSMALIALFHILHTPAFTHLVHRYLQPQDVQ